MIIPRVLLLFQVSLFTNAFIFIPFSSRETFSECWYISMKNNNQNKMSDPYLIVKTFTQVTCEMHDLLACYGDIV